MSALRTARQIAKKIYIAIDPANVLLYRMAHGHRGPIPPAANRIRIGSPFIGRFMQSGRNCHEPISRAIRLYGGEGAGRMLDFGCGAGRVLQFFERQGKYELSACDVDPTAISYLNGAYPKVASSTIRFAPPTDYPSEHFDIIYSVSVWTHLHPAMQEPWLREMRRILRPGGIALLTVIGPYGYRRGTHLQAVKFSLEELLSSGFQYSPYEHHDTPGTGPQYGAAYHTPEYVNREWGKVFRVLDVQEGVIDNLNDLVVLG